MFFDQITLHDKMLTTARRADVLKVCPDPAGPLQWWLFSPSRQHLTILLERLDSPQKCCPTMVSMYSFNKFSVPGHLCNKMKHVHAKKISSHCQIATALWTCWGERTQGFGGCAVLQRRCPNTLSHVKENKASGVFVRERFLAMLSALCLLPVSGRAVSC